MKDDYKSPCVNKDGWSIYDWFVYTHTDRNTITSLPGRPFQVTCDNIYDYPNNGTTSPSAL